MNVIQAILTALIRAFLNSKVRPAKPKPRRLTREELQAACDEYYGPGVVVADPEIIDKPWEP